MWCFWAGAQDRHSCQERGSSSVCVRQLLKAGSPGSELGRREGCTEKAAQRKGCTEKAAQRRLQHSGRQEVGQKDAATV